MFVKIQWRAKQFSRIRPCLLPSFFLSSSVSTYVYNVPLGGFTGRRTTGRTCTLNWWQFLCCPPWNEWIGNGRRSPCWPFSPGRPERRWAPCCAACPGCRSDHRWGSSHRCPRCPLRVGCLHSGWRRSRLSSSPGRWRRPRRTGSRNWPGPRGLLSTPCPSGISQETWLGWCPGRPLVRPRTACGLVWQERCSTCVCPCGPTERDRAGRNTKRREEEERQGTERDEN